MRIFEGTGFLIQKTGAKVITCYLRGVERFPYSPNTVKKQWFPEVTAHFDCPETIPTTSAKRLSEVRGFYTEWLRQRMVEQRFTVEMEFGAETLFDAIQATAKREGVKVAVEDVSGKMSYRELMLGARVFAGVLDQKLKVRNKRVGVLMPNVRSVPGILLALWRLGKEAAMLNFSLGVQMIMTCAQLAGVEQVLTSRTFVEKAKLDVSILENSGVEVVYLEDLKESVGSWEKLVALFQEKLGIEGVGASESRKAEDTAVILFTSGSEGVPKGVALSHRNILANVRQMLGVSDIVDTDRMFNAMPMFHSFGLSVGMLLPLVRGIYTFLYPTPLHYRVIPTAFYHVDATILIATNTFLRGYAKKAHGYDFRTMRLLFAAAEKLQESTADEWMKRYGVAILEGYGATECSPCVSVNTPMAAKFGTVGRLLPGMQARIETVDGISDGGRLWVKGANVMQGYLISGSDELKQPEDGWYDTGDIVQRDSDGFLMIRGRMKRFAKISGEMVSLTAVEDALAGAFVEFGNRVETAVVALPDGEKGERLVVLTNESKVTLESVRGVLRAKELPNIAVPREVRVVSAIPKLGTGKVDYRTLMSQITQVS